MIKNSKLLRRFERELMVKEKPDVAENYRIAEALYREAVRMGVFPLKDPLEGLEVDTRIAKVVNSV